MSGILLTDYELECIYAEADVTIGDNDSFGNEVYILERKLICKAQLKKALEWLMDNHCGGSDYIGFELHQKDWFQLKQEVGL